MVSKTMQTLILVTVALLYLITQVHCQIPGLATDLEYYDVLSDIGLSRRVNNVNVFDSVAGKNNHVAICKIDTFFPFTNGYHDGKENPWVFMDITSALLAIHHLNNGIGDIVPALQGLNKKCNVRFTADFFDTLNTPRNATVQLNNDFIIGGIESSVGEKSYIQPCAVVGPYNTPVALPLATISNLNNVFHTILTRSNVFDDKNTYPLVGRVYPAEKSEAVALVRYLKTINVTHCAMIYSNEHASLFEQVLHVEAKTNGIQIMSFALVEDSNIAEGGNISISEDIKVVVNAVKDTQYRHICAQINLRQTYRALMREAYNQGITGSGYNWIFGSQFTKEEIVKELNDELIGSQYQSDSSLSGELDQTAPYYQPESPILKASYGASSLNYLGGLNTDSFPNYQKFLKIWKSMDQKMVDYVTSKWPKSASTTNNFTRPQKYWYKEDYERQPDTTVVAIFDSVIAIGLAACNASFEKNDTGSNYFNGEEHFNAFINLDGIEGATGPLKFLASGSRDPSTALYGISNILPTSAEARNWSSHVTYVTKYDKQSSELVWTRNPATENQPHIYSDGSNKPPPSLPPFEEKMQYIGLVHRGVVLTFCAVILLFSVGCGVFTVMKRDTHIVRSSQPFFLVMVCIGTFLMGNTLIPIIIDDEIASIQICNVSCIVSPWLYTIGFVIIFSALFSKTRRINKIFTNASNFRRAKVTRTDVLPPLVILLASNILLLSILTALDPPKWIRVVTNRDAFGRPLESHGLCVYGSDKIKELNTVGYALLFAINMGVLLYALYQSYLSREIHVEFNESRYITLAIGSIFQIFFIGLPLNFFLSDRPREHLVIKTAVVVITSMAVLTLLFIPKILALRNSSSIQPNTATAAGLVDHGSSSTQSIGMRILVNPYNASDNVFALRAEKEKLLREKKEWIKEKQNLLQELSKHNADMRV